MINLRIGSKSISKIVRRCPRSHTCLSPFRVSHNSAVTTVAVPTFWVKSRSHQPLSSPSSLLALAGPGFLPSIQFNPIRWRSMRTDPIPPSPWLVYLRPHEEIISEKVMAVWIMSTCWYIGLEKWGSKRDLFLQDHSSKY